VQSWGSRRESKKAMYRFAASNDGGCASRSKCYKTPSLSLLILSQQGRLSRASLASEIDDRFIREQLINDSLVDRVVVFYFRFSFDSSGFRVGGERFNKLASDSFEIVNPLSRNEHRF